MAAAIIERDLKQVGTLQRLLLTCPMPHALDDWRAEVNRELRRLTGADRAVFMLPNATSVTMFADIPYADDIDAYPALVRRDWSRYGLRERALALEVCSRRMLYHPHEREVYRSAYYNETVVPAHAYDSLSMTCSANGSGHLVQLMVHHDRPVGRKFGRRERILMRLLYPSFVAGVAAYQTLEERLATLPALLDSGSGGICLFSAAGTLLHANPRAAALFAAPGSGIDRHVRQLVEAMCRTRVGSTLDIRPVNVAGPEGPLRVTVCAMEASLLAPERLIVVTLESPVAGYRDAEDVRRRYGLTRQQSRVALLLAERRTNAEIAERLCISRHTAKRHVEQVLARLGVASRNEVDSVLRRSTD